MSVKSALLISFVFLTVSCGRVSIGNHEFCGDMGRLGASCFKTLSDEKRDIPKKEWDQERVGMVCGRAEAFADWKQAILTLCKMSRKCWYSYDRVLIEEFGEKLKSVENPEAPVESPLLDRQTTDSVAP